MFDERGFIEPVAVLPVQFWTGIGNQETGSPEKKLMMAVLKDAAECFEKYYNYRDGRAQALFRGAQEWIYSSSREWPYSYLNICDSLGINPFYLRRRLEEHVAKLY